MCNALRIRFVHKNSYVYRINGIKLQGIVEDYILTRNKMS